MKITSPAFTNGSRIPKKYTCEGPNISPPLSFSDIPPEAESLVLMIEDPDAPAKPWVHWLVFNISPTVEKFDENAVPKEAEEGLCNGNTFGYEGPCPPENEHRYLFKLYAIDKMLDIPKASDRKAVLKEIEGHIIAQAELVGKYKKEEVTVG